MKHVKKILLAGCLLANLSVYAAPEPYESVRTIPYTPYFVQDGYVHYSLIQSHNAAVIVDVESQDGGVARYIAQQAESLPSLQSIYSISAWPETDPVQKRPYQRFLSNVNQEKTAELITPIRMNSLEAATSLNIRADFISLVGANDQERLYKDILAWYPHLSDNGVICGNNWYESAVELGVTKAAKSLDLNLKISGNVWYFEKN
ncbi:MAG TPA: class I SAM-dependent methyltransferase [Parachlamydiaceae bacterium]|nr:class I SAM-dependent methyltransferase [Parachlamydiaceae bacterium]